MKVHPAADLLPRLAQEELEELANSIREKGLLEPIVTVDYKGEEVILDGRNRFQACQLVGVEPVFEKLDGDDAKLLDLVDALNDKRRHLDPGERALFGTRLVAEYRREASQRKTGRPRKGESPVTSHGTSGDVRDQVAKAVRVSNTLIDRAVKLAEAAGYVKSDHTYTPDQKKEARKQVESLLNRDDGVTLSKAHAAVFPPTPKEESVEKAAESLINHALKFRDKFGVPTSEVVQIVKYGLEEKEAK